MPCDPKHYFRSCHYHQQYWKSRPKKEVEWGEEGQYSKEEHDRHIQLIHDNVSSAQCTANGVEFRCPNCREMGLISIAIIYWNGHWACREGSAECRKRIFWLINELSTRVAAENAWSFADFVRDVESHGGTVEKALDGWVVRVLPEWLK